MSLYNKAYICETNSSFNISLIILLLSFFNISFIKPEKYSKKKRIECELFSFNFLLL